MSLKKIWQSKGFPSSPNSKSIRVCQSHSGTKYWDTHADLERVLCVLDEVDSEVEVDGRWQVRREGGQSEDLDSSAGRRARFSGQSERRQAVGHHVTLAGVHLHVDRSVDRLTTQLTHRLQRRPQ